MLFSLIPLHDMYTYLRYVFLLIGLGAFIYYSSIN
jgi:hypothetical protein